MTRTDINIFLTSFVIVLGTLGFFINGIYLVNVITDFDQIVQKVYDRDRRFDEMEKRIDETRVWVANQQYAIKEPVKPNCKKHCKQEKVTFSEGSILRGGK